MNKIDVEEFVNKIVNDDLIRAMGYDFMSDDVNKCLKKSKDVSDDYDQKPDYGIYVGDSENAKAHLLNTLSTIYQKKIGKKAFPEYEEIIQKDLKNWLKCIDIYKYSEEIPEVFCIMVRLGYGEIVCGRIETEYQSCKESKQLCIDDLWIPDYAELYIKLADYCLFTLGDARLARRYYHLAAIDWYGVLAEDVYDRRAQISKEEKLRIEQNRKLVSELDEYYDLLPMNKSEKYKRISDIVNAYIRERNSKYTFSEKILGYLLEFADAREKCWNSCSFLMKRVLLIISHRLREEAIADIVVVLCKEDLNLETKLPCIYNAPP